MTAPLRIATWLAPGIPLQFFEICADHLRSALARSIELRVEARHSGPMTAHQDSFGTGEVDLGFLCAPSYLWLRQRQPPSVELVPAAAVPVDPRAADRPVYFSEIIVRIDERRSRFEQLAGRRFAYNDESSLSGYFSLWKRAVDAGWDGSFFGALECSGSHVASLEAIVDGSADAAAIDANVLARWRDEQPDAAARIRSLETLGPFPMQPVVLRTALAVELREPIARALLAIPGAELATSGVRRFSRMDAHRYDDELDLMRLPEQLPSGVRWLDRF